MKYLRYAIGEIVLVVIGILIAFQVNTWNEKRKNDLVVNTILKQVHTELGENIMRANELAVQYQKRDSVIRLIMTADVEDGDYENFRIRKHSIESNHVFEIKNKAYEKISLRTSNSSSYLDSLITDLNELYISKKEEVDWSNSNADKISTEYLKWLQMNTTWYGENYFIQNRKISDEEFYFHKLNNSIYINHVFNQYDSSILNQYRFAIIFRNHAIKTYRGLSKKLNLKENEIDGFSTKLSDDVTRQIAGTYIREESLDTIKLSSIDKAYYYNWNNGGRGEEEVLFINKTSFNLNAHWGGGFRTLDFDKNNNLIGFTARLGNVEWEWKKIK